MRRSPPVIHHPAFRAEMPVGHRFPMDKFSRLASVLEAEGVPDPDGFVQPEFVDVETLLLAHSEDYVRGVIELSLPADVVRRIGMPNTDSVATRARAASGGTLLAARLALAHGIACNTAGGSHHASAESGAGFCVFNDVAVAARRLLAEGAIGQALVVDLDVELADGTGDAAYLEKLEEILPALLGSVRPDIVFFNAGVDPHADDKLGRLSLTDEGLGRREAYVLGACLSLEIPVVGVIGGGYDADIDRLAARHAILHRTAKSLYSSVA